MCVFAAVAVNLVELALFWCARDTSLVDDDDDDSQRRPTTASATLTTRMLGGFINRTPVSLTAGPHTHSYAWNPCECVSVFFSRLCVDTCRKLQFKRTCARHTHTASTTREDIRTHSHTARTQQRCATYAAQLLLLLLLRCLAACLAVVRPRAVASRPRYPPEAGRQAAARERSSINCVFFV